MRCDFVLLVTDLASKGEDAILFQYSVLLEAYPSRLSQRRGHSQDSLATSPLLAAKVESWYLTVASADKNSHLSHAYGTRFTTESGGSAQLADGGIGANS